MSPLLREDRPWMHSEEGVKVWNDALTPVVLLVDKLWAAGYDRYTIFGLIADTTGHAIAIKSLEAGVKSTSNSVREVVDK